MKHKKTPRQHVIHAESGISLQSQVEQALAEGHTSFVLEGRFVPHTDSQFSLLSVPAGQHIKIIGDNKTTLDGRKNVSHLLFIDDGSAVEISGINFLNGGTSNHQSTLSSINHPQQSLNIFRYLDGGAITIGENSTLKLSDCIFSNNEALICGGAISNLGGYLEIEKCEFSDNSCGDTGAAIDNLSPGSLAIIRNSVFKNNQANMIGGGNYGSITSFPNTFLFVKGCDFTNEMGVAIDWTDKTQLYENNNVFGSQNINSIVKNPTHGQGVWIIILRAFVKILFFKSKYLNKLELVPKLNQVGYDKHQEIYKELV